TRGRRGPRSPSPSPRGPRSWASMPTRPSPALDRASPPAGRTRRPQRRGRPPGRRRRARTAPRSACAPSGAQAAPASLPAAWVPRPRERARPRPGSDLRPDLLLRPVDLGLLQLDRVEESVQVVAVQLLLLDHRLGDLLDGVLVEHHELARR